MRVVVRVKPGSSKGPLVESDEEGLVVFVREKAIDGAANDGVIKILADHFDVPKSRVRVVRGHTARIKQIEIDD
ncbi:DUF167 domain-containing protein [Aurantimicrobium minutum]|jgi:uncharacterized protein YggU (UPF0235/DUF167 family)|uniref:DUF167 domain-containing protein n=1 Tax=Aurantimicrobium minutum TaxID=708131 RepID=UPI002406C69D|nr:DUF167 domain-containing protein [Aurantimicrobium minutum]MDF9810187.1 uncharacterized protein YggU (UPF0235/DUF167 family) [Aurantimicrobium minutum]MDH6206951.1 uncharacterized protein YggU (UPF0235/DUF167 family) [Aurantimicrobium minutum]MDH6410189.1 uncharacterized protein YggU (UPF0235/DUF167 family) [Aurantimicrobium minutum]MDH6536318.1 uncharacterized protein YggU (UPF0235/DUF167 family) [Aurantimicrobium minutum]